MIHAVKDMEWKDQRGDKYLYTGEVDLFGKVCGFGTATGIDGRNYYSTYEGTFFNGRPHGICMSFFIHKKPYLYLFHRNYDKWLCQERT